MSLTVTLTNTPIEVTIDSTPIVITLANIGPQGIPGPAGAGFTPRDCTANVIMATGNAYVMDNVSRLTAALPATANFGDTYQVIGKGVGGWMIAQNPGQTIHVEGMATTTGTNGYLQSQTYTDCATLMCITANTDFLVTSLTGNLIGN